MLDRVDVRPRRPGRVDVTQAAPDRNAALRLLAEFLPTIVWATDADLRITAAFGEGISGLDVVRGERIGLTIADIFGGHEDAPAVRAHERALDGEATTYIQEFMGRMFHCHVEPLEEGGEIGGVIGVALDVTEREQARELVREERARFRALVERLPAAVFVDPLDPEQPSSYVSPQIEDLLGFTPEEWTSDAGVWARLIHPDDRERVVAAWRRHLHDHDPLVQEYRMHHRAGRTVWIRDTARIVRDRDGTPMFSQGFLEDITRSKRAELALRRTNQALRALIEASPLAISAVDLEGKVTLWNSAAQRMFGWSEDEVLGKPIPTIPPRAREEWRAILDSGSGGAVVSSAETTRLRKDGSEIELEIARAPIRDDSGNIVGIFGIFTDIRERKRAEQALRASEERYRGLFENALDIVFTTDLDGRFTAVNRAAERVNGYTREELLRMNIVDLVVPEHRDVVRAVLGLAPTVRRPADADEVPTRYELDVMTKDGKRHSLEAVIRLVWDGDEPVAVEGIARDVTDRRRAEEALRASEERYRELFENARDMIYTHDLDGRITSVNKAAERVLGIPRERMLGASIWKLIAPDDVETARAMLRRKLDGAGPTRYEIDAVDPRGRRVPLEVSTRLILDDGRPVGVQGIARDISERRRAQEALQRSERQFRSLIENALDIIAVLDEDLTIRYATSSLERELGYEADELIGRPVIELLHPDDAPLVQQALSRGLDRPRERVGLEVRVRHRDGTWRVIEGIGANLLDDPDIGGIIVNARDVTERKRHEDSVRFLTGATELLTSSLDIEKTLTELAQLTVPTLADWCVIQLVDEIDVRAPQVFVHSDPSKEERARRIAERWASSGARPAPLDEVLTSGRPLVIPEVSTEMIEAAAVDDVHAKALRELGMRSALIVPLPGPERILGAMVLMISDSGRDLNEDALELVEELGRRAAIAVENARLFHEAQTSRERFRELVEGVQDYALFRLDADGLIESWHPTAERIFGYRGDEIVGRPVSHLYPEDGPDGPREIAAARALREAAEHGTYEEEGWRVRRDGSRLWVTAGTTALRDDDGRLTGFSRITRDVSARKQAEIELEETLTTLRRTDEERRRVLARLVAAQEEERERIAADIHDDSLQVMVAVGMRLEMLEGRVRDEAAREDLEQLRRVVADSVRRLRVLLFDVRPPVLDSEGLAAALRLYATQMRTEMGFVPDVSSRLTEEPPGDIATIAYRIAAEALQNAKKHARASRIEVALEDHDDGILVRVTDDGVGFAHADVDARLPGHLGLVTMRERAEVAGGWLRIDSTEGRGTTVEFWLPAQGTDMSRAS